MGGCVEKRDGRVCEEGWEGVMGCEVWGGGMGGCVGKRDGRV